MARLWIATANTKKRTELIRLLEARAGLEIKTLGDLPEKLDIVEDQPDFAGNAAKKASTLALATGEHALGDDSGLCVDALGGKPGVLSARYGGAKASDADRIAKLLKELDGVEDRTARFVCHLALAGPDGSIIASFEETCEGSILTAPRGKRGFGYDPVFAPEELEFRDPPPSFAELSAEEKDRLSHRGKALRKLAAHLHTNPLPS